VAFLSTVGNFFTPASASKINLGTCFRKVALSSAIFGWLFLLPSSSLADFYVDSSRIASGDGSSANPWKNWGSISWSAVSNALRTASVKIYLSSRDTWSLAGENFTVGTSGNSTNTLFIVCDEKYNLIDSGTASWQPETMTNRARLSGYGSLYVGNNSSYIQIQGLYLDRPTWGGVILGTANPTINIHHITVTNCVVDSPPNNQGIWLGFGESGCHSITVTHCTVTNTPAEGIYMGHFSYLTPTITNCVIEYNTVINCGLAGEGDIDIKPGVKGAIIRYNTHYRTAPTLSGGNCGVVMLASDGQIYGNTFHHAKMKSDSDWGYGIYVSADGDALGNGQSITNCLIYNNLLYGNERNGIRLMATTATPGADITGVKICNNTIWSNAVYGVELAGYNSRQIVVEEFKNNIIGANGDYDVRFNGNVTVQKANSNLYFRNSGQSWYFNGAKTFAAWQALGFDTNGLVADPLFVDPANRKFDLSVSSPGVDAGEPVSWFSTDIQANPRGLAPWDIGAYEYGGLSVPTAPVNLRVQSVQ
jgi:hypothetical protein